MEDNEITISKDEYKDIEETIYLSSIPGYLESIEESRKNITKDNIYVKGEDW